ncbi:hypothetical protein SAMN06297280_2247 [Arsukibacterium tuosuense]|uniref:Uncharacterized protein n=1 Tax=Arsukibacterium tuosuense TaxID=1323745 RepID=A0A285IY41_9GAMM|nr:hypothetical protein [Arsukibacterium tuosuense]SNY52892.1 hypothetical protein SAMN06297280_2247 [Arsukibacterium tuosuense]
MPATSRRHIAIALIISALTAVAIAIAIVALWLLHPRDKALTATESLPLSTEQRVPARDTAPVIAGHTGKPLAESPTEQDDNATLLADVSPELTETAASQKCQALEQALANHPASEQVKGWYHKELSADLHDSYYQRLSMDELLQQAQAADISAMRMLAEKYLRYARFQRYDRPVEPPQNAVLDRSALAQARYWAEQAALHGYGGAFMLLAEMYFLELEDLNRQLTSAQQQHTLADQIIDTELLMRAYLSLSVEVMPQLHDFLYPVRVQLQQSPVPAESRELFDDIFQNLLQEWQHKRALMGLAPELEFFIPAEVESYIQLENQLHNCNNQLTD